MRIPRLFTLRMIAGISLVIYSCSEDFLTREPPGAAAGFVIMSPDGVESVLIGAYSYLKGRSMFGGGLCTDWVYGSITSDDCYKGTSAGDATTFNLIERYQSNEFDPYISDRWNDCYTGVSRANSVLEVLAGAQKGKNPLYEQRALEIEAEAKFLRAWFHFQANKVFEHIPYIKTAAELAPVKPEEVPNPNPAWDEIEADLQFAIDNLPPGFPGQPGRADRYAAEAVKAHCHMYQQEFDEAKILLDDLINSGGFVLAADFCYNYDMIHENNSESIFEVQAATTSTFQNSVFPAGAAFHQLGPASCGGWGFFQPSQCLFEAFQVTTDGLPVLEINDRDPLVNDMGISSSQVFVPTDHLLDPRVDWTIARRGIDYLGWGIHPGNNWIREQANGGPYMTKKYMHNKSEQTLNLNGVGFYNGKNYRMYRLANILLWRAEVAVEENDLEKARILVNKIRERAKASATVMGFCTSYSNLSSNPVVDWSKPAANYKVELYPSGHPAFASKEEARKAVTMELRLEFATEGHRFFDLRRWGTDGVVLNDYIARDRQFRTYLQGAFYNPEKNDYWPLPASMIDQQKRVLLQDPDFK